MAARPFPTHRAKPRGSGVSISTSGRAAMDRSTVRLRVGKLRSRRTAPRGIAGQRRAEKLGVAHQFGAGPVKLMLLTFLIFDWLNLTRTNWQYVGPLIAKDALLHLKQR